MKKINIITLLAVISTFAVIAQPTLTFEKHALVSGTVNEMKLTEYVEPGPAGSNQIWDFSELAETKDFRGLLEENYKKKSASIFPRANVELKEFNNLFQLNVQKGLTELFGYTNESGNIIELYDQPVVKMKYPFTYKDWFNGPFSGTYTFGESKASVTGTYFVEADAWGKLILPDNSSISKALRVKSVTAYTRIFDNRTQDVEIETYRWYADDIRFPLLVLTKIIYANNAENPSTGYQAAYRDNLKADRSILSGIDEKQYDLSVYPNPFAKNFNISYQLEKQSDVLIELYDAAGKKVKTLVNANQLQGAYKYEFTPENDALFSGAYTVQFRFNDKVATKRIVQIK